MKTGLFNHTVIVNVRRGAPWVARVGYRRANWYRQSTNEICRPTAGKACRTLEVGRD